MVNDDDNESQMFKITHTIIFHEKVEQYTTLVVMTECNIIITMTNSVCVPGIILYLIFHTLYTYIPYI